MKLADLLVGENLVSEKFDFSEINIEKIVYKKMSNSLDIFLIVENNFIDYKEENLPSEKAYLEDLKKEINSLFVKIFPCQINVFFDIKDKVNDQLKKTEKNRLETGESKEKGHSIYDEPVNIHKANRRISNSKGAKENITASDDNKSLGTFSKKDPDPIAINEVKADGSYKLIRGCLQGLRLVTSKTNWNIYSFDLEDSMGGAINCKFFAKDKNAQEADLLLKNGNYLLLKGKLEYDEFEQTTVFQIKAIRQEDEEINIDPAPRKRVELAIMSRMSNMEGLIDLPALLKRLKDWGHEAFAVCDKDSLQAYPEMGNLAEKNDLKILYGLRAKVLEDGLSILSNPYSHDLSEFKSSYTVFDIETTGFSPYLESIIEIGAVRYENGIKVGSFSKFVNPKRSIPERITELTGIDDSMVRGAEEIDSVLPEFLDFAKDSILVAQNADFDISFIRVNAKRLAIDFSPVWMDTMTLARCLHPEYKNHKLDTLCKNLQVVLLNHHRAIDDAQATGEVFLKLMSEWQELDIDLVNINKSPSNYPLGGHKDWDLLIYCQKQSALKYLYEMCSEANLKNLFRGRPGIAKSVIDKRPDGLLIVGGFLGSELFEACARDYPIAYLDNIIDKLDAVAVEPPSYFPAALKKELVEDEDHYKSVVEKIILLAEKKGKNVFAIASPSYLDEADRTARNILVNYQFKRDFDYNSRYRLKNTQEMLDEFAYIGRDRAESLVIDGPNEFIKDFEKIKPIPDGTFSPEIEGAAEDLRDVCYKKAEFIYGNPLPDIVAKRLERELSSIITNGYASLYIIARELVLKSERDGYLVGSRGSVGSSFAAHMAGITEVNPLSPHYVCPKCKHSEFIMQKGIESGFDLEKKKCPICGTEYNRDGHTIPFEVFLGFEGDKEPDIDLNFAGQYMSTIHKYTEEFFGQGKVFRAGTISGVQEKTAFGFIKKYMESPYVTDMEHGISKPGQRALQRRIVGTKRTTGQHAGGLMIVPANKDITDFTPIQYPADDPKVGVITTHFSYKNLSGRLLKLDELGHTGPTIIKDLEDLTGLDPLKISFDDPDTMALFNSGTSLRSKKDYSNKDDGSLGIPEFGTPFVRGMLKDTRPSTFGELCRISGLSHGTDVWLNNAQELIRAGKTDLKSAICTRDDIMTYLISMGLDKLESFKTMESVRKGKGIPEEIIPHIREKGVEDWYIESCQRIKYMFPKAHATAYVMLSYRIGWFKVHRPQAFYASYFSQHLPPFEGSYLYDELDSIQEKMTLMKETEGAMDEAKYSLLEIIEEMLARGFCFAPPDLYKSKAVSFSLKDDGKILPPLAALDDISEAVANNIIREREKGEFISRSALKKACNLPRAAYQSLVDNGLLDDLPESNQMSFFAGF